VYEITDTGREFLQTYQNSPSGEAATEPREGAETFLRGMRTLHGLKDAVKAIARSGDPDLIARAVEILDRTRRELYALLADEK
jgi:hypothetical protein